ncbi:methyltransferase [Actinomadura rubrisoli]|uniref:methyltransferase n=1 Tax=Actinomadura rubrisoli TaxID=2530368 RepID=UPI001404697E|nr:methyltransferase [Actinomadura rubrisoli]
MNVDIAFSRVTQLAIGYWQAKVLFTLNAAGVFARLGEEPRPLAEVSGGTDPEALTALLDAGVALGLVTRAAPGAYTSTELTRRFLDPASPESLADWVGTMGAWCRPWGRLDEWLRDPGLLDDVAATGAGGADERGFVLGMHQYAARTADAVASAIDLPGGRAQIADATGGTRTTDAGGGASAADAGGGTRIADVGGGAGTYSFALCRRDPGLTSVVLDRPSVLPITLECAAGAGLDARVAVAGCDYRTDSFGSGLDAVLLSNVLHQEAPDTVVSMLERGRAALRPGGRVIVHGHFLEESRTAPMFSTLHNISAMLLWGAGRGYTVEEMLALIDRARLDVERVTPVPESRTTVIVCRERDVR